ncbi:MAG: peptidoglycan DD-metalloendopeptidase family protein [Alphaproteobacteria bacterium]|nr:peptidoglycan DD-metalloendopeptidase family protein [Alphaproteobacteria bacterium]
MRNRYSYHRDYKRTRRNILESVRQAIRRAFPERSAILYDRGVVKRHRLSPNFQLFLSVFMVSFISWMGYTSFVYFKYKDIMQDNASKVEVAQEQYKQIMAVVNAYESQISSINDKIDKQNTEFAKKLEETKSLTNDERKAFFKDQRMLVAELGYFNKKIKNFSESQNFAEFDQENINYQYKKMEIQRDVAWKEQQRVTSRNKELEKAMVQIQGSYEDVLNKIEVLAGDKVKEFEKKYAGIHHTLDLLGLKNEEVLLAKLEKEESVGGPFVPLEEKELPTESLSQKFRAMKDKVNLWEGLSKMEEMLPVGNPVEDMRITSRFGPRKDPFTGQSATHNGIDFSGKTGTPLYSVARGHVVRAGLRGAYGYAVEVDHGLGFSTLYAHLSKITVDVGDEIKERDIVGLAGSTGRSTGPHLHYEVRYNGRPINPYAFVQARFIDYGAKK